MSSPQSVLSGLKNFEATCRGIPPARARSSTRLKPKTGRRELANRADGALASSVTVPRLVSSLLVATLAAITAGSFANTTLRRPIGRDTIWREAPRLGRRAGSTGPTLTTEERPQQVLAWGRRGVRRQYQGRGLIARNGRRGWRRRFRAVALTVFAMLQSKNRNCRHHHPDRSQNGDRANLETHTPCRTQIAEFRMKSFERQKLRRNVTWRKHLIDIALRDRPFAKCRA